MPEASAEVSRRVVQSARLVASQLVILSSASAVSEGERYAAIADFLRCVTTTDLACITHIAHVRLRRAAMSLLKNFGFSMEAVAVGGSDWLRLGRAVVHFLLENGDLDAECAEKEWVAFTGLSDEMHRFSNYIPMNPSATSNRAFSGACLSPFAGKPARTGSVDAVAGRRDHLDRQVRRQERSFDSRAGGPGFAQSRSSAMAPLDAGFVSAMMKEQADIFRDALAAQSAQAAANQAAMMKQQAELCDALASQSAQLLASQKQQSEMQLRLARLELLVGADHRKVEDQADVADVDDPDLLPIAVEAHSATGAHVIGEKTNFVDDAAIDAAVEPRLKEAGSTDDSLSVKPLACLQHVPWLNSANL